MPTDQMGSLARLPGGSLAALGRNAWPPVRLRLKSWHNTEEWPEEFLRMRAFAEPKGPPELSELKECNLVRVLLTVSLKADFSAVTCEV